MGTNQTPFDQTTEIQKFYAEKKIFLTGGSGFLGKLLIEKLLRTCQNVDRIYVLLREKKGVSPKDRLKNMFNSPLFELLEKQHPNYMKKMELIEGDCEKPNLGLSEESIKTIQQTNCIFHCAATVRFDEKIRKAAHINVRATRDLLRIAKNMPQLSSFIHVSTAYSNCTNAKIEERFYEAPMPYEKLLDIVDLLEEQHLEVLTPSLKGKWPNTYAFTKCIAEDVVKTEGKGIPLAVVRPSIVVSTSKEPIAGWIDNIYGPTGVLYGAGLGLLHCLQSKNECVSDLVPADYVINLTIASAAEVDKAAKNQHSLSPIVSGERLADEDGIYIFNFVSRPEKPITWGTFNDLSEKYGRKYRPSMQIWHTFFISTRSPLFYRLAVMLFHFFPAYVIDFLARLVGRKPIMVKAYKKIDKFSEVITYFATGEWDFRNENTKKLWKKIGDEDKKLFEFSMALHDWDSFFETYVKGGRIYFLKDPLSTLPKAHLKSKIFVACHYLLCSFLLWLLYKLISFFVELFV